jgi:GDPmannose 4,6-dehydratase
VVAWLEYCFGKLGKNWKDFVKPEPGYQPDFKRMVSDSSLLQSTGWTPLVDIEELANLMLKPAPQR